MNSNVRWARAGSHNWHRVVIGDKVWQEGSETTETVRCHPLCAESPFFARKLAPEGPYLPNELSEPGDWICPVCDENL